MIFIKNQGFFVTFEGPDMSGKTTQINLVSEILREKGYEVVTTFDPGDTKIGQKIRKIVKNDENIEKSTELLLFTAARAELIHKVIIPALNEGKIVLCDRFIDSTYVYQGMCKGWGIHIIQYLHRVCCSKGDIFLHVDPIYPDLTFIFTGQFSTKRQKDKFEKDEKFAEKVREGYEKLAEIGGRYVKINPILDKNAIAAFISQTILDRLRCRGYAKEENFEI